MSLRAGFGSAVITPEVPVMLAGFGARTAPAQSVHDDLECRALYLDDGATPVCLIILDLLGLSEGFARPIREAVASELEIPVEAVITSCTHTHSGPSAMEGAEKLGWPVPDGYRALLVRRCVEAARHARDAAEECIAFAGEAPLPADVSFNRRGLPYDPSLAVFDLRRVDGSRAGIVANIAIHPVAFGSPWLQISTDWVGPFRRALEERAGGTALMLSGALGDVNPIERHTDVEMHMAEATEEVSSIAAALVEAVSRVRCEPVKGPTRATARTIDVQAGATPLAALLGAQSVSIELVEWMLGDVNVVAVPGEAFSALGNRIREARTGVTLIAGLACTWEGYLPVPFGDGYEETVSLGMHAVAQIADALVAGSFAEVRR